MEGQSSIESSNFFMEDSSCGCLSTCQCLIDKHVSYPIQCEICSADVESEQHIFFTCLTSIQCWDRAKLSMAVNDGVSRLAITSDIILDVCSREVV